MARHSRFPPAGAPDVDRCVLLAVVGLDRAGWRAIADRASAIAGYPSRYQRFAQPNVRAALDRLDAAGLVVYDGTIDGRIATISTPAGRSLAAGLHHQDLARSPIQDGETRP